MNFNFYLLLSADNKIIPAGVNIIVPIYSMNHSPKLFHNAEEFIPERYLESQTAETQNPFSYIPFSAGPRNCIGQKFAVLEIKSIVSKLLRHYTLKLDKDSQQEPVLSAELVLRPDSVINFNFIPRVY